MFHSFVWSKWGAARAGDTTMQIHSQRLMRSFSFTQLLENAPLDVCIPGVVVQSNRSARDRRTLTCEFAILRSHLGRTTNDGLMLADTQTPSQIATRFPRQASSRGGLLYLKEKEASSSERWFALSQGEGRVHVHRAQDFSFHRMWTSDKRRQCAR